MKNSITWPPDSLQEKLPENTGTRSNLENENPETSYCVSLPSLLLSGAGDVIPL